MSESLRSPPASFSTQTQLLAMAASLIVPIICVAIYLSLALYKAETRTFKQSGREAAQGVSLLIEREIAAITRALQVLAQSEALRQGDLAAFQRQASEAATVEGLAFAVRSGTGAQIMKTDSGPMAVQPSDTRLIEIGRRAETTGKPAASGFFATEAGGQTTFAVVLAVTSADERIRYISASSSVDRLLMLMRADVGGRWQSILVDDTGHLLAETSSDGVPGNRIQSNLWEATRQSPNGVWVGEGPDGASALHAYQTISSGWVVVVRAPFATLEAGLLRSAGYLAAGLAVLAVLAVGSALVMARRISRPVVALEDISLRLSRGEAVTLAPSSNREANNVGRMLENSSVTLRGRERALAQSQARYRSLFETIDEGFCIIRMIRTTQGHPLDFRIIEANAGFEAHSGLRDVVGRTALQLQPDLDPWWIEKFDEVARTGESVRFERKGIEAGSWFDVHATCISAQDCELAVLFEDITLRKQEEVRLRVSEARFRAIQETSVDGFMLLESVRENGRIVDFIWTYANDAAARILDKERNWFPGRRLLEEMPGNRIDGLFDAYVNVVETGEHWTREFTYNHEGLNLYFRTVAVRADDGFAVTFADLSVRRRAEEAARKSEARLAAALKAGQLGVHEYFIETGRLEWDGRVRALWGLSPDEEVTFEKFEQGLHPDDRLRVRQAIDAAQDPANSGHFNAEYRVIDRATGKTRWLVAEGQTIFANGKAERILGTVRDVTARRQAEQQRILLVNELNHRVKNTLATVQSIAAQSFRNGPAATKSMLRAFEGRLSALARAHNILTREHWEGSDIDTMLRAALAPHIEGHADPRIVFDGPPLRLSSQQGVALAMAAHELATNALKYGALLGPDGHVSITWDVSEAAGEASWANVTWQETGGSPVSPPTQSGFGTRLLTRGLARELDGSVDLVFPPTGVECRIAFPVVAAMSC